MTRIDEAVGEALCELFLDGHITTAQRLATLKPATE